MKLLERLQELYIYIVVLVLLSLLLLVIFIFASGKIDVESAKVYLQALTAAATLALLYYAYFNVASKKEEDIARLELAVRPIFAWEVENDDGGAELTYRAIKHPIYDLRAILKINGEWMRMEERHLDVSESHPDAARRVDVSRFISKGLGKEKSSLLELSFSYHSEVGGKYEFSFTKDVLRRPRGFSFQHRKIISAKYPWRKETVSFSD